MYEIMMDINSLCQFPQLLLENIYKNDDLKDLFANTSPDTFMSMMSHTIYHLLEDNFELPPGHTNISILQSQIWLRCFKDTLNQLPLSDEIHRKLDKNMTRLVRIMTHKSYTNLYESICSDLKDKLDKSEHPSEVLRKVKHTISNSD